VAVLALMRREPELASSSGSRLSGVFRLSSNSTPACTAICLLDLALTLALYPQSTAHEQALEWSAQLPNRRVWNAPRCRLGFRATARHRVEILLLLGDARFCPFLHPPHFSQRSRGRDRRTRWADRNEELSAHNLVLASTRI